MKAIRTSVYLPENMKNTFTEICKKRGLSVSSALKEYVYSVVNEYNNNQKKK